MTTNPTPSDVEKCIECNLPFTHQNVLTQEGWREIKISQMCELCFDKLFEGDEE
jgi:hypothetical protein